MKHDFILNGVPHGSIAQKLLAANMDPNVLRTHATLRKDEWEELDEAVVRVSEERLVGVMDLINMGLTYDLNDDFGTMVLESESQSDITGAEQTMDGITRTNADTVSFDQINLPLPITHKDFQMSARVLAASRKRGNSLDTTNGELAARKVSESVESMLFNGVGITFGGGTIYGYTNHPDRNTFQISGDWADEGAVTGEQIVQDVIKMIQLNQADGYYGPYNLYVPTAYGSRLSDDYKANSDKTIKQRLLEIDEIADVKTADQLSANNVVLAQMTVDVVRVVRGRDPQVIEWEGQGGLMLYFKAMAILVPQIRSDKNSKSGVCHGAP